jgi:hypothetical protein
VTRPRPLPVSPGDFLLTGVHMRVLAVVPVLALASPVSPSSAAAAAGVVGLATVAQQDASPSR